MKVLPVGIAVVTAVALTMTLSGCQSGDIGSDPNNPNQVEAITWWASGVDQTALYDLVDVFTKQDPDIQFIDASVRGASGENARASIRARLDADNPPDTFQAVAGAGLRDYVVTRDLQDLTEFYAENGLAADYRADLLEFLTIDGRLYSVPSDIHRVNVVWTSNQLLTRAGVDPARPPATLDAWLSDLAAVRASGIEYPLALGDDLTQVLLFEDVLIADLGPGDYRALWTSSAAWDVPAVHTAIEHYARLLEFADPDTRAEGWPEITKDVVFGQAAYVAMADYALPEFDRAGFELGNQYSAMPAPGTAGTFDFLADSFTLPVGAVHQRAAERWLLTVSSAEGQQALSLAKGSIPARAGTDGADYPPYQRTAIASLETNVVLPSLAHGVAADSAWTKAITTAVVRFGVDGHPTALVNALARAARNALEGGP
jgi:glucose/mannose transport system substrate-binding protein